MEKKIIPPGGFLSLEGAEILSDRPLSVRIGFKEPESLHQQIKRLIRRERIEALPDDTLDDLDDFEVSPTEPSSPYEMVYSHDLGREITQGHARALEEGKRIAEARILETRKKRKGAPKAPKTDPKPVDPK
jgi:hypothetical protein